MRTLEKAVLAGWRRVPAPVRASPLLVKPKRAARRLLGVPPPPEAPPPPPPPVDTRRVVRDLETLDEIMAELDRAAAISDDELRRVFLTFRMEIDLQMPEDPYSDEYRAKVLELYEWLHGRPYELSNEATPFDVATAADKPFPYSTQSAVTVGNHLIGIGYVIRALDLPPSSRVLEFGPGWGNTTLALARMGHRVTAVDIDPKFVQLVQLRSSRVNAPLEVIEGDFSLIHELEGPFDAVLFFECFHHCADHLSLLRGLDRVVAPGGRVVFAAEPIIEDFHVPWGLRFDGEALWAIRKNGWMELGFRESYFRETMARLGWTVDKQVCHETPWGTVFVARRAESTNGA